MSVDLKYDKPSGKVNLTVTFNADSQVRKEGLEKNVIEHHLIGQAVAELTELSSRLLNQPVSNGEVDALIDQEAQERIAKIQAEASRKKAIKIKSDV